MVLVIGWVNLQSEKNSPRLYITYLYLLKLFKIFKMLLLEW